MKIVDWTQMQRFDAAKMQKVSLFDTDRFFCDVYCFEPGQSQKVHVHADADKFYMVFSGKARVKIGGQEADLVPPQAVLAPAGQEHGVTNTGTERLVVLTFMAPKGGH